MTTQEDRIARMHAVASQTTKPQTQHSASFQSSVVADAEQQDATDMKTNTVYQIMNKTSLSGDERIAQITKYLTVENDDYTTSRKRFGEFRAYFDHVQNEGMQQDMKGIEKLIEEMNSSTKPQVEKIVNDLITVQNGIDKTKGMLDVMREARIEGTTIEKIKEAIDINDKIIAALDDLSRNLGRYQSKESGFQSSLEAELQNKVDSEKGFSNSIKRMFAGPDKLIAQAIESAKFDLQEMKDQINETQATIDATKKDRNEKLESGPLLILRSIDATENSFAQEIISTATSGLELITGASATVRGLTKRLEYSKEQAREISTSISQAEIREAILEGAVKQVALTSHDQSEHIKQRVVDQDTKLGATEDVVQKAVLNAERVSLADLQKTALAFEEDVSRTHANFTTATANSVAASSQATSFWNLLLAEEDVLQQLSARAVPETTRALRLALETDVGMQTSELASSIGAITRRAMQMGSANYQDQAKTQEDLRTAKLKTMEEALEALTAAQDSVVTAAEATVKHSKERGALTGSLAKATAGLRDLLEQFADINTRAADPEVPTTPYVPAAKGPSRPVTPANDIGGTAPKKAGLGS